MSHSVHSLESPTPSKQGSRLNSSLRKRRNADEKTKTSDPLKKRKGSATRKFKTAQRLDHPPACPKGGCQL